MQFFVTIKIFKKESLRAVHFNALYPKYFFAHNIVLIRYLHFIRLTYINWKTAPRRRQGLYNNIHLISLEFDIPLKMYGIIL